MLEKQERELVVDLHQCLCHDEFGRAIISMLEDLLYRTCHLQLPIKHLNLVQNKLTPRNKQQFDQLRDILQSVEDLASSGNLAEVVLLQGSTVPLAKVATHIRMQPARWDDNTPRNEVAYRQSLLEIFRAVCAADLPMPKLCKSFLFVRLLQPQLPGGRPSIDGRAEATERVSTSTRSEDFFDIKGFKRRPGLPVSRALRRTVFSLRQDGVHKRTVEDAGESFDQESDGVWLQLAQHLPTVSYS